MIDYVIVDRGFGDCHIPISIGPRSRGKPLTKLTKRVIAHLEETIGVRGPGEVYQHSCEIHQESWVERKKNPCINPDHVSIGDHSTNAQTMHALRAEAGLPWAGARPAGSKMAPYKSEPWTCPDCGREMTYHQASLHALRAHGKKAERQLPT